MQNMQILLNIILTKLVKSISSKLLITYDNFFVTFYWFLNKTIGKFEK